MWKRRSEKYSQVEEINDIEWEEIKKQWKQEDVETKPAETRRPRMGRTKKTVEPIRFTMNTRRSRIESNY